MIRLAHVSKTIAGNRALVDVSLDLTDGVIALLGANGAGKTTLLRVLATLISPDSGEIFYHGRPYGAQKRALRQCIGYLPQYMDFPADMTPRVLLNYLAQLRRLPDMKHLDYLIDTLGLRPLMEQPIGALSGGQIRALGIAQALMTPSPILLLDELYSGLGIEERQATAHLLMRGAHRRLTVFSTNLLEEVERMATGVIILSAGRVRHAGPLEELRRAQRGWTLEDIYLGLV